MAGNNLILIILGIIAIILIGNQTELFTVFPNEGASASVIITNQKGELNFLEGDTIIPMSTEQMGCGASESCVTGVRGYMIFVNNKLFALSGNPHNAPHYSICGTASTSQEYWENNCGSWQHTYRELLKCSSDSNCDYAGFNTLGQNRLEAGNNQEVEVLMRLNKNDGGITSSYSRFKINVASLPCVAESGQLLVAEVFGSGNTINKNNLRYSSGFVKTCSATPPIVADQFTLTYYQDLSIYTKLNSNQDYIVPNNRAATIFYLIDNKPEFNLPGACEVYNLQSERCESLSEVGFVTTCTDGTFNPDALTCTVIPGKRYICEVGQTLNLADLTCDELLPINIKQNYTIINDCEDKGGFYNKTTNICKFIAESEYTCLSGFDYNNITNKCEKLGGYDNISVNQEISKSPSAVLYVVGGIVLLIMLFSLFRRKA